MRGRRNTRHEQSKASLSSHERTLDVIEAFYEAALDETLWPVALKNLADLTASQAASFWVLDGSESPRLPTFICINFDENSIQEYLNGMARLDPTVRYLVNNPRQSIVHDGLLGNGRDEDSRAYNDWHERNVETRFRMVAQAPVAPSVQSGVALHRTRKVGRYEVGDVDRFAVLHRHLQRALSIGFRIGSTESMRRFGADWLDHSADGVLLLDANGLLIFANRTAEAMQAIGDGVQFSSGGIVLARKKENRELQNLIGRALAAVALPGASTASGGAMRATRPSGKRSFGVFVSPVTTPSPALSLFRPAVCVVISDPDREPLPRLDHLQRILGLTRAEAKLAAILATGQDLQQAAEMLGITYGTARSRLAQIFQKTETRRQGQLVRLLLQSLPPI